MCRVTDELTTYLEDEAQREEATWDSEPDEVETCDVCQENVPVTEFTLEGICECCYNKGTIFSPNLFQAEDMHLYAI